MPTDWLLHTGFDPLILPAMKRATTRGRGAGTPTGASARAASRRHPAPSPAKGSLPGRLQSPQEDEATLLECLDGIRNRDQSAIGRLYDLTVSRVYGVALRIVRRAELAEEVVPDVYMQVWREAGRYDSSRGRVMAWLLIIARTRSLDLLRRQDEAFPHPNPHDLASDTPREDDLLTQLSEAHEAQALHAALGTLTPLQRQLLSLAFFKGLTHSEIVAHSGLPLGSVKTHIRRALAVLREHLQSSRPQE